MKRSEKTEYSQATFTLNDKNKCSAVSAAELNKEL